MSSRLSNVLFIRTDKASTVGGKVDGVGVMENKKAKLQEITVSHTLGGSGGRSCPGEREVERV
jgi:hypothetical protein